MSFVWGITLPEGETVEEGSTSANIENPAQTGEGAGGSSTESVCMLGGLCIPPDIYFLLFVVALVAAAGVLLRLKL